METKAHSRLLWIDLVPLAVAIGLLVSLAAVWWARLRYGYDLEWMEGGMLVHAWRLHHGLGLYVEPSPDFIPFLYPPGYPAVLAVLGHVVDLGYTLGRAVSLVGVLAAAGAIVSIVRTYAGSWRCGLLAAVVFLGCYSSSGGFFDLVRGDGLFIGVLAWAVTVALWPGRRAVAGAGLLLAAAWIVKQPAALYGLPIVIAVWARDGRKSAAQFAVWSAGPALLATLALQWHSGGRFLDYLIGVPSSHPFLLRRAVVDAPWELSAALPVALICGLVWLASLVRRRIAAGSTTPSWRFTYGVGVAVIALVTSAAMRGHWGGFVNVLIPLFWVCCVGFGIAIARWRSRHPAPLPVVACSLAFTLQLALQWYQFDPQRFLPTDLDRKTGDDIVARLRHENGPVFSPFAPWLPVQAGHAPGLHIMALWDVSLSSRPFPNALLDTQAAIDRGHWGALLLGDRPTRLEIEGTYEESHRFVMGRKMFWPKTGWTVRPAAIYTPRGLPSP